MCPGQLSQNISTKSVFDGFPGWLIWQDIPSPHTCHGGRQKERPLEYALLRKNTRHARHVSTSGVVYVLSLTIHSFYNTIKENPVSWHGEKKKKNKSCVRGRTNNPHTDVWEPDSVFVERMCPQNNTTLSNTNSDSFTPACNSLIKGEDLSIMQNPRTMFRWETKTDERTSHLCSSPDLVNTWAYWISLKRCNIKCFIVQILFPQLSWPFKHHWNKSTGNRHLHIKTVEMKVD